MPAFQAGDRGSIPRTRTRVETDHKLCYPEFMEKINFNKSEDGPSVPDKGAEKGMRLIEDIKNYSLTLEELSGRLQNLKEDTHSDFSFLDLDETDFDTSGMTDTSNTEVLAQESHFKVDNREEAQEKIKEVEKYLDSAQAALKSAKAELDSLLSN